MDLTGSTPTMTDLVSPGLNVDQVQVRVLKDAKGAGEAGHPVVQRHNNRSLHNTKSYSVNQRSWAQATTVATAALED